MIVPPPFVEVVRSKVWVKMAETERAPLMVTLQAPEPLQFPPQALKTKPAAGVAVRLTAVPAGYVAQPVPQLVPVGELAIVPLPVVTVVRSNVATNVAETALAVLIVTLQAPEPEQAPPHALNANPAEGACVSVTTVPVG